MMRGHQGRHSSSQMRRRSLLVLLLHVLLCLMTGARSGCTSSYVRNEFPSVDIPLEHESLAAPEGHNAPHQVHITQGDYDGKAVIVSWVTVSEPAPSEVFYGKEKKRYDKNSQGTMTNYTFYDYQSGYIHHCLVDDLEYNTKYYYKIGTGDLAREFWFQTPPAIHPDAPYTFGIIGDLGQTFNSLSTLQHYEESGGQSVLYVGDLSYADTYVDNDGDRWDSWGQLVERSAAYQPWIWNSGNHEIEYMPGLGETYTFKPYLHRYTTPHWASKSSSALWYAVRRASAHIIVLSSYSPFVKFTPQWKWLKKEFKRVNRIETPWLIVLMHTPMYSSNHAHYMEGESMRVAFEEWFIKNEVDLVFAGHVHAYERSHRISNVDYKVTSGARYSMLDESAPLYITVGDGGNEEGLASRFNDPQPDYSAFREASYGHSTLQLKNRTHAVYQWHRNDDGKHVQADQVVINNQYWESDTRRRRLEKRRSMRYESIMSVL